MLVDTSVWIDFFNQHPSPQAQMLRHLLDSGEPLALCGVVYTEILLGFKQPSEAKRIADLLTVCDWLEPLGPPSYAQAAELYRQCRRAGYTVRSTIDCLIAQLCIENDLPLLAKDSDFSAIAKVSPLRLAMS